MEQSTGAAESTSPSMAAAGSPALEEWLAVASEVRAGIASANEKQGDRGGSRDSTEGLEELLFLQVRWLFFGDGSGLLYLGTSR